MGQSLKRIWVYLVVCAAAAVLSPAQTFTTLVNFDGTNGGYPGAPLVQATNGDLYGTTSGGGGGRNMGTIFRITPAGALTALHRFDLIDGAIPLAGLVQAANGDLYGTTGEAEPMVLVAQFSKSPLLGF